MKTKKINKFWKKWKKGKLAPKKKQASFLKTATIKQSEISKVWTTIYYGERGSGKTLHQSKEMMRMLNYLKKLYTVRPDLHKAIVFTNQNISAKVKKEFGEFLYHWEECEDFKYCPRVNCWRGKKKHNLHGCYLIFDDVSIILDPRNWPLTPDWLKKYFILGRHFGIHMLASLVNPNAVDISFRRCIDVAYQFTKIVGSPDPDETKPAIKTVFGIYRRRKIDAKTLFRTGDLPEQTIRVMLMQKAEAEEELKKQGKEMDIVEDNSWKGSYHMFNRTGKLWPFGYLFQPIASTEIYDTLQNVKEFEPKGYLCKELKCIEPTHFHPWEHPELTEEELKEAKKRPDYCNYTKKIYDVV